MPDPKLSLPQRALLLILMAENRELSNNEIGELYSPSLRLTGRQRTQLESARLIESRREGNGPYRFVLQENGWAWCRKELTGKAEAAGGNYGRALFAVLGGLDRYLERTDRSLAHLFGGITDEAATAPAGAAAVIAADDIEREIRRAYRKVAKPVGGWVGLADIREHLNVADRAQVDGVLRLMVRIPGVRIEEETNQKALTRQDRAAAVRIGDRDQHVLAIEEL